jgi:hypothetical protein
MHTSTKIFLSLILIQASAVNLYAASSKWTMQNLFEAAHKNFNTMKRDASKQRSLVSLSETFSPHNFAGLSSSGASEKEIAEIINALDKVHEFGMLRDSVLPSLRESIPADALAKFCHFEECYESKEEYNDLFKLKADYTWAEALHLMFGTNKYSRMHDETAINVSQFAAEAARFNEAYEKAEHRVHYRNKYNKVVFPIVGLMGMTLMALNKA